MEKAKKRQKDGIVKPQVVAGREFKGIAFISKPDKIIFKDFTVGVPHTQTILLTNVSFSFNSFKLLPLNDNIKVRFFIQDKMSCLIIGFLLSSIYSNWKDVSRSINYHHNYIHSSTEPRHKWCVSHSL